jgi:hypothetical protein
MDRNGAQAEIFGDKTKTVAAIKMPAGKPSSRMTGPEPANLAERVQADGRGSGSSEVGRRGRYATAASAICLEGAGFALMASR